MGDQLVQAKEYEKKAEKKLNGWCCLFGSKYDVAAQLLGDAANSYKLAKSCTLTSFFNTNVVFF